MKLCKNENTRFRHFKIVLDLFVLLDNLNCIVSVQSYYWASLIYYILTNRHYKIVS